MAFSFLGLPANLGGAGFYYSYLLFPDVNRVKHLPNNGVLATGEDDLPSRASRGRQVSDGRRRTTAYLPTDQTHPSYRGGKI